MSDDLLNELRRAGQVESHGAFTVDPAALRLKMRDYLLTTPFEYGLWLVQAAVLLGWPSIEVKATLRQCSFVFPYALFPEAWLEHPLGGLMLAPDTPEKEAWRCFSVAINTALGTGVGGTGIEVISGGNRSFLTRDGERGLSSLRYVAPTQIIVHRVDLRALIKAGESVAMENRVDAGAITLCMDGKGQAPSSYRTTLGALTVGLPPIVRQADASWRLCSGKTGLLRHGVQHLVGDPSWAEVWVAADDFPVDLCGQIVVGDRLPKLEREIVSAAHQMPAHLAEDFRQARDPDRSLALARAIVALAATVKHASLLSPILNVPLLQYDNLTNFCLADLRTGHRVREVRRSPFFDDDAFWYFWKKLTAGLPVYLSDCRTEADWHP